ncbi:right-handed parallel beta-helix repeat-containing protein [Spirosoma taeanense]|nr:right-handed parallel beta-helix repeat-containing protein [Spirosoma taeanense]
MLGTAVRAQSCNCTYTITKTGVYDGALLGIAPGSTVCIKGGAYQYLRLNNFTGAPGNPITFVNCDGLVDLNSTQTTQSGLNVQASRYFRITGTGDSRYPYGIKVSGTGKDATAMNILAKSSDCEIDHVEIASAGFAGIMVKTDPKCDPLTQRGGFIMYNVKIHENYVHDTKGEGFYIGHSNWGNGVYLNCDGTQITVYPHEIIGLELYNNITDHTGAEGIQFSCSIDAQVHHNTVTYAGVSPFGVNQDNGVQIGGGTSGRFYNNVIQYSQGDGISMLGHRGPNYIYNNLITNSGINGIYIDNRTGTLTGPDVVVANNTIITTADGGIRFYNETNNNYAYNNAIAGVTYTKSITTTNNSFPLIKANNLMSPLVSDGKFVDAATGNYRPTASSPLVNAGKDVSIWGITADLDNNARLLGIATDVGAYEYIPTTSGARIGATELIEPIRMSIYPAPAQEQVTIRLNSGEPIYELSIIDGSGRTRMSHTPAEPSVELTVTVGRLNSGLYLVRVRTESGTQTGRLLRQ